MPNTLAHMGVNGVALKSVLKNSDLKWIYLSAIIPDIPWIFQRIVKEFPNIDAIDLRLYSIVQASLLFCIIFSLASACISKNFCKTFIILGSGSLTHLFLDAMQTKWANGIHLFAPFSWELTSFGFFWPESIPTYLITLFGLIYVLINWRSAVIPPIGLSFKPLQKLLGFILLLGIYFILPLFLLSYPLDANNHFVKTLRNVKQRQGAYIEFDRTLYLPDKATGAVKIFTDEIIFVEGINYTHSAYISLKGRFTSPHKILVKDYHVHWVLFRDGSSYVGLFLFLIIWLIPAFRSLRK